MKITMTLDVEPEDVDEADGTGLTSAAYDRLSEAIADAGFEFDRGPDGVTES